MYNQFFTIKPRINFGKKRRKQSCTPNKYESHIMTLYYIILHFIILILFYFILFFYFIYFIFYFILLILYILCYYIFIFISKTHINCVFISNKSEILFQYSTLSIIMHVCITCTPIALSSEVRQMECSQLIHRVCSNATRKSNRHIS